MPLTALQFKFIPVDHTTLNSHSNWVTGFRDESVRIANQVEQLSEHSIRSNLNPKRIRTHWMGLLNELEFAQNQQTKVCWNDLNFNFVLRNQVLNQNIWFTKGNLPQRESLSSNSFKFVADPLVTKNFSVKQREQPRSDRQGTRREGNDQHWFVSKSLSTKFLMESSSYTKFRFWWRKNTWSF